MPRRKLQQLHHSEYRARTVCSTGAETAAAMAIPELGLIATPELAASAIAAGIPEGMLAANFLPSASASSWLADNALSLGAQGAGAFLKGQATQDAEDRRTKLVNALGAYQTGNAKKAMDTTERFVEGSTLEARAADLQAAEDEARAGFERSVGAAQAFERSGGVAGNLSDQYKRSSEASADAESARTKRLIENLSKMRSFGTANATGARRFGRAAGEVDGLNSANASVGRAYQSDLANVAENPWAITAGEALSGVGQGLVLKKRREVAF